MLPDVLSPSPSRALRSVAVALAACVLLSGAGVQSAEAEQKAAPIIARAVAYDYNLRSRAGPTLTVAVLFKAGDTGSEAAANRWLEAFKALEGVKLQGVPLSAIKLAHTHTDKLGTDGESQQVDVLFIAEGLDDELGALTRLARARKWLTIGTRERHTREGLSLAVFNEGGRNVISVNLPANREEGVAFASDLLRLARVIR
jgi:hypothetical protein